MRDKIIAFFDAAKDLALAIASRVEDESERTTSGSPMSSIAYRPDEFDEEIEIRVWPIEQDTTIVEIAPKQHAAIIAATTTTPPCQYQILSIVPTIPDPGGKPIERLGDVSGIDVAFFDTGWPRQVCPFDFGTADPTRPIKMKIQRIAHLHEATDLRMKLLATYLPVAAE